ncbi:MAG: YhdP family protein, partial [Pseudomonadota bacterium]
MKKRLRQYAFHVGRVTWHVSRWTLYASLALLALLAIAFGIARHLLPMIAEQKPSLEEYLSQRTGHQVRIDSLHAYWDGLYPGARVQGLQVFATDGTRPAIRLSEVRISLSLLPLLWGDFAINSLVVVNPSLALERLTDGRFRISGFDPLAPVERGQDEKFVNWLFQQGRLEIENGELQWFDHREAGTALHLGRVNLSLRNNGDRHRLVFNAVFPDGVCDGCSAVLDVKGNPLASPDWDGEIYLRAGHINISTLPLIAREKLPDALRGKFTLQLRSEWNEGRPVSIRGSVKVSGLRLPVPGWETPLGIREAGGDLVWRTLREGWRLDVANPLIGLEGRAWSGGHLRIVHRPEASDFRINHADVGDITAFAARLKGEIAESAKNIPGNAAGLFDAWLAIKPEGNIENFRLSLQGDWMSPADYALEADIRDATVLPYLKYPGARSVSGHLSLTRHTGNFRLDAIGMELSLPRIFRAPLSAEHVSGDLSWERYDDYWLVNGSDLRLSDADGRGSGKLSLRLPHDHDLSPMLKLRVDFQDGNGARAARYYPASHLKPETLAWMERSFVGGEITEGYLIYDGPIRDFPFRQGTGKFELRGHVRNGIYRFLPGWEPVRQAEVDVAIDGSEVTVVGGGKIGKLDATQVVVQSRYSGADHHVVHVGGKVSGSLNETLNVLREARPEPGTHRWLAYLPPGLQASGAGLLSLDITIPLADVHSTGLQGEYRFMKNTLRFAGAPVAAEAVEGSVRFTQAGLHEGNLRARFLGGETELVAAQRDGRLFVQGQGVITAQGLAPVTGNRIAARLSGAASWSAAWQDRGETGELRAETDLRGLKAALPAPLDRPGGLLDGMLTLRTESARPDHLLLVMQAGESVNGRLAIARNAQGWGFAGAQIGFGGAPVTAPTTNDIYIRAEVAAVDADQWMSLLGDGTGGIPAPLGRVSASVKSLVMFDRRFENLAFDFLRRRDVWQGTVNGANVAGAVKYSGKGPTARYEMNLTHLTLPDKLHERADPPTDPRRLPAVVLRSKSFELRGKSLGELDFMAEPDSAGWQFRRLNLTRADMKLNADGRWDFDGTNHVSRFNIEFSSPDMGKTMDAFGAPDQLAGGEVSVKSQLSWTGSPANPQLAALSGKVDVSAKKGRFLKVKSGAGRLFGLLDLSAIGRYLTLDFTPVFGKGLIYDRIQGEVKIEKGNAYTSGFTIRGPANQLDIGGRIGLAAEDFDLALELQPKISDTVTIATWGVLGPQVAAAVLAVQKLFKKQIAK